jgi:hypothetical protein
MIGEGGGRSQVVIVVIAGVEIFIICGWDWGLREVLKSKAEGGCERERTLGKLWQGWLGRRVF